MHWPLFRTIQYRKTRNFVKRKSFKYFLKFYFAVLKLHFRKNVFPAVKRPARKTPAHPAGVFETIYKIKMFVTYPVNNILEILWFVF